MDLTQTALLGLIAGGTILLGLPVGRMRRPVPNLRGFLNAATVGILLFLFWDILVEAWEPVDESLAAVYGGTGDWGSVVGFGFLFAGGLALGYLSLVAYESWMVRRAASRRTGLGPGAMALAERPATSPWTPARQLALLIAVGIGLHNFAEGLAIGQSAARGDVALATLLVIGFALHNATEGFGIVGPLGADTDAAAERGEDGRPGWGFLVMLGAIGGAPTFLGSLIGHGFSSEAVSLAFLTVAAGSILYVVVQLIGTGARIGRRELFALGLLGGLLAGFLTDAVITVAGV